MKERPILFSAPMVRALLDGSKTQTRRVVKKSEQWPATAVKAVMLEIRGTAMAVDARRCCYGPEIKCPYGQPGDRLWVRESFCRIDGQTQPWIETDYKAMYEYGGMGDLMGVNKKWTPSIHMPRHASRITLEITGVRVERLENISEVDAMAEGIATVVFRPDTGWPLCNGFMAGPDDGNTCLETSAVRAYRSLWESINGHGSWNLNPWVWVLEFRRVEGGAA